MKYHRTFTGDVPGQRDRDTGPVTISTMGFSGTSRALNRLERSQVVRNIEDDRDAEVAHVNERAAKRLLEVLRDALRPFNLSRHTVTINAGMGATWVSVGDRYASDLRAGSAVVDVLQEIDQMIDGMWDIVMHLDQEKLS